MVSNVRSWRPLLSRFAFLMEPGAGMFLHAASLCHDGWGVSIHWRVHELRHSAPCDRPECILSGPINMEPVGKSWHRSLAILAKSGSVEPLRREGPRRFNIATGGISSAKYRSPSSSSWNDGVQGDDDCLASPGEDEKAVEACRL